MLPHVQSLLSVRPYGIRSGGGYHTGSFKVESPQTRTLVRPMDSRRQRMLAVIVTTLGILLGGLVGAAVATESDTTATVTESMAVMDDSLW